MSGFIGVELELDFRSNSIYLLTEEHFYTCELQTQNPDKSDLT